MSWYKIIKFADAKSKIRRMGITDPFMKAYLYRYENAIPWSKISNKDDLENYFLNLIEAFRSIINSLEDAKKDVLSAWLTFASQYEYTNMDGGRSNAQIVIILKPLLEYAKTQTNIPDAYPIAIRSVLDEINQSPESMINILKECFNRSVLKPREDGWHYFSARGKSRKSAIETASEMATFVQGSGWCVSNANTAYDYLYSYDEEKGVSDFHILIENGKPVVAVTIAFREEENKEDEDPEEEIIIDEVQGRYNKIPNLRYLDAILERIDDLGLKPLNPRISDMEQMQKVNSKLKQEKASGQINTETLSYLYRRSGGEISMLFELLDDELKSDPTVISIVVGFVKNWLKTYANSFPVLSSNIKKIMSPDDIAECINEYVKNGYSRMDTIPFKLSDKDLSPEIISKIDMKTLVDWWLTSFKFRSTALGNFPVWLLDYVDKRQLQSTILESKDPMAAMPSKVTYEFDSRKDPKMRAILDDPEFVKVLKQKIIERVVKDIRDMGYLDDIELRKSIIDRVHDSLMASITKKINERIIYFKQRLYSDMTIIRGAIIGEGEDDLVNEFNKMRAVDQDMYIEDIGRHQRIEYIHVPREMTGETVALKESLKTDPLVAKIVDRCGIFFMWV